MFVMDEPNLLAAALDRAQPGPGSVRESNNGLGLVLALICAAKTTNWCASACCCSWFRTGQAIWPSRKDADRLADEVRRQRLIERFNGRIS